MGLDTVELIWAVEDAFQITPPNREAERISTVGDLYQYVLGSLRRDRRINLDAVCASAHGFYQVRQVLCQTLGVDRRLIRPSAFLEPLLPRETRRRVWKSLSHQSSLNFPALRLPKQINSFLEIIFIFIANSVVALGLLGSANGIPDWVIGLVVATELLVVAGLLRCVQPFQTEFPANCATVGALARILVSSNPEQFSRDLGWTEAEVWNQVRSIVAEHAGVEEDSFTEASSFVYDLGPG